MAKEKIVGAIYGISKTVKTGRPHTSIGGIGVGSFSDVENTIFVTDKRVMFVAVPVGGAGLSLGSLDVSTIQSVFNKGGIKERGEELIRGKTVERILKTSPVNFDLPFDYLESVKFGWFGVITFKDVRGKKYRYTVFGGKKKREELKKLLSEFIPEKLR